MYLQLTKHNRASHHHTILGTLSFFCVLCVIGCENVHLLAVKRNRAKDPMTSHGLNDIKADVGEDPLHVVVDRLPVLLDVPVPRFVHQAAWIVKSNFGFS